MNKYKRIIRKITVAFLTAFILLSITVCENEPVIEEEIVESPYLGNTLIVSNQQTWIRNKYATKVSQVYIPYKHKESQDIVAFVYMLEDESGDLLDTPILKPVGSGTITNGILNFSISEQLNGRTINDYLLKWKYTVSETEESDEKATDGFRAFFSRYWVNVRINNEETNDVIKGNMVLLMAQAAGTDPFGMLDRQGMSGTSSTISCETILYFYVNHDCLITGDVNSNFIPGQYYFTTEGNLYLPFKKGWNLVSRGETYGKNLNGHTRISMGIKNPIKNPENYKWVMEAGFEL